MSGDAEDLGAERGEAVEERDADGDFGGRAVSGPSPDGGIFFGLLAAAPARRRRRPGPLWIAPDRQRASRLSASFSPGRFRVLWDRAGGLPMPSGYHAGVTR